MTLVRLRRLGVLFVTTGFGCGGGDGGGGPQVTTTITKAPPSGDSQTDTVLTTLPLPYRVLVTRDGAPAPSASVSWSVPAGQGTVSATSTTTGADGIASVTRTLGPTAGTQTAQASTAGATATASFSATATAGNAAVVEAATAGPRTGTINSTFTHSVRAEDEHGNPKAGVTVNWAVHQGTGSINPTQSTTGANGIATTSRTLGPDVGTYTDTATSSGLTGSPLLLVVNAVVAPQTAAVSLMGLAFDPDSVLVGVGGTVTWTWNDGVVVHNVTFTTATGAPANIDARSTGSQQRTFSTAGLFNYSCTLHAGMAGKVAVVN